MPAELASTLRVLQKCTLPLAAMADPIVARGVSDALGLTLDQRAAAADTSARRRRGLNTALEYGVDLGELKQIRSNGSNRKRSPKMMP
ncbi:hypothetical protein OG589_41635 [Sphaerisporangium sp. NBC_01403]|uniref:hypothetical protein n=1 Tax=Sphaerisporangium sp. NBC_01403 TaxID=2903599 RepID=UPI0032506FEE